MHSLLSGPPKAHGTVEVVRAGPSDVLSVLKLHRNIIQNAPAIVDTAVEVDVQLVDDVRGNGIAWLRLAVGLFPVIQTCRVHIPAQAKRAVGVGRELGFRFAPALVCSRRRGPGGEGLGG